MKFIKIGHQFYIDVEKLVQIDKLQEGVKIYLMGGRAHFLFYEHHADAIKELAKATGIDLKRPKK
jgi:hypothetical protein